MREILSQVTHIRVGALQVSNGFLSVITASLATGNLTLRPPEFGLGFFVFAFRLIGPFLTSEDSGNGLAKTAAR